MSFSHTLPKEANFTLPYLHVRGRKPARSRVRGRRGDIWRRGCVDSMINGRFLWTDSRMPKSDRYGDENNLSIGLTKESTRSGGSAPSGVVFWGGGDYPGQDQEQDQFFHVSATTHFLYCILTTAKLEFAAAKLDLATAIFFRGLF